MPRWKVRFTDGHTTTVGASDEATARHVARNYAREHLPKTALHPAGKVASVKLIVPNDLEYRAQRNAG